MNIKLKPTIYISIFFLSLTLASSVSAAITLRPANNLGLVGYWSMDEGLGTKVGDMSGRGNAGTLGTGSNAPSWVSGKRGEALSFDGSSDYVTIGSTTAFDGLSSNGIAISAWVKYPNFSTIQRTVSIQTNDNNDTVVWLQAQNSGVVQFGYGGGRWVVGATTLKTNTWYHIVGLTDFTIWGTEVYVNGVLDGEGAADMPYYWSDLGSLDIGRVVHGGTHYYGAGTFDEVRVYNRVLSATEIAALYRSGVARYKNPTNLGLVGYWSLDEGSGTKAGDMSGMGNHGMINAVFDNFDRGVFISFNSSLGSNWSKPPDVDIPTISGNKVTTYSGTDAWAYWNTDTFNNDQYAQCRIATMSNNDTSGPFVRVSNTLNRTGYGLEAKTDGFYLVRWYNGSYQLVDSETTSPLPAVNDILKITAIGNLIKGYKNGVEVVSYSDPSPIASGQVGFYVGDDQNNIDDWEGGYLNETASWVGGKRGKALDFGGTTAHTIIYGNFSESKYEEFTTNPSSRWTTLRGTSTWDGSPDFNMSFWYGYSPTHVVYNGQTVSATQYARARSIGYYCGGDIVLRSTKNNSDGYYVLDLPYGANANLNYYNNTGYVETLASTSGNVFWKCGGTGYPDYIGVTIQGVGTSTAVKIWENTANVNPYSADYWDGASDSPDHTISLSDYAGSNFANAGRYVGMGSGDGSYSKFMDNWSSGDPTVQVRTVAFWMKPDSTTKKIISFNSGANIEVSSGTIVANNFVNPTIYVDGVAASTVDKNWHHIVVTTTASGNPSGIDIGRVSTSYFDGMLDEVRIYNRALSATEISNLYSATKKIMRVNVAQNDKLTNGLVGFWTFNAPDIYGTTTIDRSGNSNNGTIYGATVAIGKVGQALSFDGISDYADIADPGTDSIFDFSTNDTITISAWINPFTFSVNPGVIISKDTQGSCGYATNYHLFHNNGCSATCSLWFHYKSTSLNHNYVTDNNVLSLNNWQHVAMSYTFGTGNSMKMYINGQLQSGYWYSGTGNNDPLESNQPLWIGAENNCGAESVDNEFLGKIDETRVYNRALTAEEVRRLYQMGK